MGQLIILQIPFRFDCKGQQPVITAQPRRARAQFQCQQLPQIITLPPESAVFILHELHDNR
jgi:hypothetical protein